MGRLLKWVWINQIGVEDSSLSPPRYCFPCYNISVYVAYNQVIIINALI